MRLCIILFKFIRRSFCLRAKNAAQFITFKFTLFAWCSVLINHHLNLCFSDKFIRTNFDRLSDLFSLINLWLCTNRWLISIPRRFFRQHIFKFKVIAPYLSGVSYRYFCLALIRSCTWHR